MPLNENPHENLLRMPLSLSALQQPNCDTCTTILFVT